MYSSKMMIVVRKDLNMRKGKLAAQAGHACVEAILAALDKETRLGDIRMYGTHPTLKPSRKRTALTEWFENGVAKICVYVNSEQELLEIDRRAKQKGLISALITDAGMTEFHGVPTHTCLAIEPAFPQDIDPITGELPLF